MFDENVKKINEAVEKLMRSFIFVALSQKNDFAIYTFFLLENLSIEKISLKD